MLNNPCRTCGKIDDDKNNPICLNCKRRLKYVTRLEQAFGCPGVIGDNCGVRNFRFDNDKGVLTI